jgi:hypothetical protein
MILNYGKYYKPVLSDLADVSEYMQVDALECDTDCVADLCVDLDRLARGRSDIFEGPECLSECGCELKVDNLNDAESTNLYNS